MNSNCISFEQTSMDIISQAIYLIDVFIYLSINYMQKNSQIVSNLINYHKNERVYLATTQVKNQNIASFSEVSSSFLPLTICCHLITVPNSNITNQVCLVFNFTLMKSYRMIILCLAFFAKHSEICPCCSMQQ